MEALLVTSVCEKVDGTNVELKQAAKYLRRLALSWTPLTETEP